MVQSRRILVVGAGFAGAVHARCLAEAGYHVDVIDKRPHIGGNAYDEVDANGIRVHCYGPHLFHTKNPGIADWLRRFGAFVPYVHRVRALLPSGITAPLPVNLDTVNLVFGTAYRNAEEMNAHLARVAVPAAHPKNAAEYLYARIGRDLTDLLFRPYTRKMWQFELEEMDAAVVKRVPIRFDQADGYFGAGEVQMLPLHGYTPLFAEIFKHPNIQVSTNIGFGHAMLADYAFCFNAMPIDEYFDYRLGDLPYRSIRFHRRDLPAQSAAKQGWSVTNFTDNGTYTRETRWDVLPHHVVQQTGRFTATLEEPCDYRENAMERYYPVRTADQRYQNLYRAYRKLADAQADRIDFIGRCGTYQYLDMDQVINQSLVNVRRHLERWK
jgi:UDP-galactopyranose mutase